MIPDIHVQAFDSFTAEGENETHETMSAEVMRAHVQENLSHLPPFRKISPGVQGLMSFRIGTGVGSHFSGPAGITFAERMTLPVMGHEEASQVGVPLEPDSEHVEDLPFVPVCGGPDIGYGPGYRVFAVKRTFSRTRLGRFVGKQVVDKGVVGITLGSGLGGIPADLFPTVPS